MSTVNRLRIATPDRLPKGTPRLGEEWDPARRSGAGGRAGRVPLREALRVGSGSVLEAPAFVAGLDDVAVVGEPVEKCGGHLGVAEDGGPFAEGEVGGDDDEVCS